MIATQTKRTAVGQFAAVPAELRDRPQWLLWRKVVRDGKSTKVPYQLDGVTPASTTNPTTWATFDKAVEALSATGAAGIGFVFTSDDPYMGIDLDDCREPATGVVEPWALAIVAALDTYAEVSPSKTGVKVWAKGSIPGDGTGKAKPWQTGAVEMYQSGRYFAVTGESLGAAKPIRDAGDAVADLWREVFGDATTEKPGELHAEPDCTLTPEQVAKATAAILDLPPALSGEGGHNATHHAACEILRRGLRGDAGRAVLDLYNAHRCEPLWSAKELDHKWEAARRKVPPAGSEFDAIETADAAAPSSSFYRIFTSAELDAEDFAIDFLIEGALIPQQPLFIAGPSKALKSTILSDAAIALATGTPFLDTFAVAKPRRVLVMSGESGLPVIQETARRQCAARGLKLSDAANLFWSADLPTFGQRDHVRAVDRLIADMGIEALFVDPAYLAVPGDDAANSQIQGQLLKTIGKVCEQRGAVLGVAAHTRKLDHVQPLTLNEIAYSAGPQYAGQWWLVNRRERYAEGSGEHRLWLSLGGRIGFSSIWGVDVVEGVYDALIPRKWAVTTFPSATAKKSDHERKASVTLDRDVEKIMAAMRQIGKGETARVIRVAAGLNPDHWARAIGWLIEIGSVRQCQTAKANRMYDGFELTHYASAA